MDSLETIYEADSSLEASVIENLLKINGVECTIRQIGLPGVFGGGSNGPGADQYQVQVRKADKDKAEQVILDYHDTSED